MKSILDFDSCGERDCIYLRIEDWLKNPNKIEYFDFNDRVNDCAKCTVLCEALTALHHQDLRRGFEYKEASTRNKKI